MYFLLSTMWLFIKLLWYKEGVVSLVITYLSKMQYLCICQQPGNSDLFKGPGTASPGGL